MNADDEKVARLRERSCEGKPQFGQRRAHEIVATMRAAGTDDGAEAYGCPFCKEWHIGQALGLASLELHAEVLRARTGNAPTEPGSGTTRRQRRRAARKGNPDA